MKVHIDRLISNLKTQIKAAKRLKSEWVYISLPQAEMCLQLAEAEDTLLSEPIPADIEVEGDGKSTWWYVCGQCHTAIDPSDKYCRQCGREIKRI